MKAFLAHYRQSPRKTRLVTELVKGKSVPEALITLKFLEKRAAGPIAKLIMSAVANAEKQGENGNELMIKSITVNKGLVSKTVMPKAFGNRTLLKHRASHIDVVLAKNTKVAKVKRAKTTKK